MSGERDPYVIDYFVFGRAKDSSPVRWVASGRRTHVVGLKPLNKTKHFGIPWESRGVEQPALRMLAGCSRVKTINSQPYSLFIGVRGIKRQFRYTPDIEAHVHPSFLEELSGGRPLFEIVADPFIHAVALDKAVPIVLEMKSKQDKSLDDSANQTKMEMVKAIYEYVAQPFFVLSEGIHIDPEFMQVVTDLEAGAHDRVGDLEKSQCLFAFGRNRCLPFGSLSESLGGRPAGERLVKALHFKQFLSIDLRRGLIPDALVWLRQQTEFGRDV